MNSPRTTPTSPTSQPRTGGSAADSRRLARKLLAYRVMAYLTGVLLLLLCASMVLRYGFDNTSLTWAAYAHGWMYLVYLVTVLLLGTELRWRPVRMVLVALAGTLPLMSFVAERNITHQIRRS